MNPSNCSLFLRHWSFRCCLLVVSVLFVSPGCAPTQKQFRVTSHPAGATIYVEGEQRGQTDMQKLDINFRYKPQIKLRLEKDGFQSQGRVVTVESMREQFFVLDESPRNKEMIDQLKEIQTILSRISLGIRQAIESR